MQAHLIQELRGLEAAAVHLSRRARNRISSAAWSWWREIAGGRREERRGRGACSVLWGSRVVAGLREGEGNQSAAPGKANSKPPRRRRAVRHGTSVRHGGWVDAPALSGLLAVGGGRTAVAIA